MTPTPPESPDQSLASSTGVGKHKVWTAGTLTYTSAGLVVLFIWLLLGDFSWSMRDRSIGPMSQWYLTHLKVPNLLFALLVSSFPAVIGLILGPIISVKSDRHRGKWGRRIPFLLFTTPLAAFGMIGLALTPIFAKWLHALCNSGSVGAWLQSHLGPYPAGAWFLSHIENETVVAVVCFGIFWAGFEVATIASQAVFGGLINDVVPRPFLGRFYGLFRAVSLIDGMIFNYWITPHVPEYYTVIMLSVGAFYGIAFTWVCLKVKEGDYPPPVLPVSGDNRWSNIKGEAGKYFRECYSNSYYVAVFVMMMLSGLAFAPVNVFAIPYATSLEVNMKLYGHGLALTYCISLALAFPLGWMADRFHPLRMAMATMAGYVLVTAYGAIWARSADAFLVAWVLHGVLSGCYFTSAASLGQRLFPHEKFAQFASAAGLLSSLAGIVFAPLMGTIIDSSGGFYAYTFVGGCILSSTALVVGIYVHSKFVKLGGRLNYRAPE